MQPPLVVLDLPVATGPLGHAAVRRHQLAATDMHIGLRQHLAFQNLGAALQVSGQEPPRPFRQVQHDGV